MLKIIATLAAVFFLAASVGYCADSSVGTRYADPNRPFERVAIAENTKAALTTQLTNFQLVVSDKITYYDTNEKNMMEGEKVGVNHFTKYFPSTLMPRQDEAANAATTLKFLKERFAAAGMKVVEKCEEEKKCLVIELDYTDATISRVTFFHGRARVYFGGNLILITRDDWVFFWRNYLGQQMPENVFKAFANLLRNEVFQGWKQTILENGVSTAAVAPADTRKE